MEKIKNSVRKRKNRRYHQKTWEQVGISNQAFFSSSVPTVPTEVADGDLDTARSLYAESNWIMVDFSRPSCGCTARRSSTWSARSTSGIA